MPGNIANHLPNPTIRSQKSHLQARRFRKAHQKSRINSLFGLFVFAARTIVLPCKNRGNPRQRPCSCPRETPPTKMAIYRESRELEDFRTTHGTRGERSAQWPIPPSSSALHTTERPREARGTARLHGINEKYRVITRLYGGEGGIRTHVTVARKPHFECGAFDLSATSP